jgi:hypothetical protein
MYDEGFPDDFEKYYEDMVDAREMDDIMRDYNVIPDLSDVNVKIARASVLKSELDTIMEGLTETKEALQGIVEQIEELEEEICTKR